MFRNRYNALYMNVDTNRPMAIYFPTIFLGRRLIYALTIMFISNTSFQLIITLFCSLAIICYLARCRPIATWLGNFLELLNESTFLVLVYMNFLFTEFVADIEMRYFIGYVFLGVIGISLGLNFFFILKTILTQAYSFIKRKLIAFRVQRKRKVIVPILNISEATNQQIN